MANVKFVNTGTVIELAPGKTVHRQWNNATPAQAVWSVNAFPQLSGGTENQDISLEVTRMWRRVTQTEKKDSPQSQTAEAVVEHEIHCEIKNVGTKTARFIVYWSVIW